MNEEQNDLLQDQAMSLRRIAESLERIAGKNGEWGLLEKINSNLGYINKNLTEQRKQ